VTLNVHWHPEAQDEFRSEIRWYDDREAGLGDRFEGEVVAAVVDSVDAPEAWPPWPDWDREPLVRSKRVAGFPYRVVYFVDNDLLTVVAVAASKRLPGYWRDRIEQ